MPYSDFQLERVSAQPTLSLRLRVSPRALSSALGEAFGAIYKHATGVGAVISGPPYCRYHGMGEGEFDIEAGMPVLRMVGGVGDISPGALPGGLMATVWHLGPYEALGDTHEALAAWAGEQGYTFAGGPWEVYVTDPGEEPDPQRWKTRIYLPLGG